MKGSQSERLRVRRCLEWRSVILSQLPVLNRTESRGDGFPPISDYAVADRVEEATDFAGGAARSLFFVHRDYRTSLGWHNQTTRTGLGDDRDNRLSRSSSRICSHVGVG